MGTKYSVVIPVYNSEKTVADTVARVRQFFRDRDTAYEIVLVNDGSADSSWSIISSLAEQHDEVIAVNLLKNYGQHNANLCGFRHTTGDYVITMDDDLQNPPSEIEHLIAGAQEGHDLVIGEFETKQHSLVRRLGSRVVRWMNHKAFHVEADLVLTNFRLIRRDVVDRVCLVESVSPYIPGLVLKYSANRVNVPVRHEPRAHGQSTYTMRKLMRLVATILFNHSTIPLRYAATFGFCAAFLSFLLGAFYFVRALVVDTDVQGFPTLVVLISFFNGVLIVLISVIGEYVLRVLRDLGHTRSYEISEIVR
jgi:polyisoprenyl-phosphate glycosyltransferase